MTIRKSIVTISAAIVKYLILIISMAGFVPKHATVPRIIAIGSSIAFSIFLASVYTENTTAGMIYFIISEVLYIGFIFLVLSKNGYRQRFMKRWKTEEEAYLFFEAILGFLFFHNATSLGFITSSSPGNLFDFIPRDLLLLIVICLTLTGFAIKIWSAEIVTIDIYYWKDMFVGGKIAEFVVTGPYRFLKNPMYGVGQLPAYAAAVWYGSETGLIAAFINQFLIFTFYFSVEKKFIQRVYLDHIVDASRESAKNETVYP